jgi:hypothetical protein
MEEITPVGYVTWWLEYARKELLEKPGSNLHHFTSHNISGGYSGWEEPIDQIYFWPTTVEERFLRNEVHKILLIAYRNVMAKAKQLAPGKWTAWGCMDITEAYRLAIMIGSVDPVAAVQMKIELNSLAARFNETVDRFASETKSILIGPITTEW